jgi:hypothetical protein
MFERTVISTRTLRSITRIDGGNTLVVEFEGAAGETVSVLVPLKEIVAFNEQLAAAMKQVNWLPSGGD